MVDSRGPAIWTQPLGRMYPTRAITAPGHYQLPVATSFPVSLSIVVHAYHRKFPNKVLRSRNLTSRSEYTLFGQFRDLLISQTEQLTLNIGVVFAIVWSVASYPATGEGRRFAEFHGNLLHRPGSDFG